MMNAPAHADGRRDGRAIRAHRFLMRLGLALGNVFAWIFVFHYLYFRTGNIAHSLAATLSLYALGAAVTFFLTPFSAAHLRRGIKRSLFFGALLAGASYVYLGATLEASVSGASALYGIAIFALLHGAYRALYWIPYKLTETRLAAELRDRAPDRAVLHVLYEILIALAPLFAGMTVAMLPFAPLRLLFGASALAFLSIVPLFVLSDARETFSWSYGKTLRELVGEQHRRVFLTTLADGVQAAALFLLWPLVVFLIVGWSYQTLGLVLSATLLLTLLLRGIYRASIRNTRFERSPLVHAVFGVTGWIFRFVVSTPLGVILADSYFYVATPVHRSGTDPFVREQAADQGSFIDEYTALKEMGFALGRILLCLAVILVLLSVSVALALAFSLLLAACASAVSIFLARDAQRSAY